ncbi:MAG: hypothetical protein ACR2QS_11995 [Woeseiaceae bacterium]
MKRKSIAALWMALAITVLPAAQAQEDRAAQFEERLAETKARLNLSDEQIEQLTPILRSGFEAQMAVLEKNGIDLQNEDPESREKLGFRDARKLRKEMKAVRAKTLDEVEKILSDEQFDEYKKIQDERQKEMREMIKERR